MARRRIEIEVLVDPAQARKGFRQSSQAAKIFGRDVERASRGALAASVSFRGLGRSVAFASATFLGGAGIVTALKSTINAAEESQRVLAQTQNAVERSGKSWERWGNTVESAATKLSQMSGFDDERLLGTFSLLVRRTKDVNAALKLNATAANVARGMNMELEAAAKLVVKASLGQATALKRVGLDAKTGASGLELITMLNQKFASSATAYANTAAGAQDRFRVALENFQEVLGARALPAITEYLNKGADWLNNTKNQQRALEVLNGSVDAVKGAVAALTPIVKTAVGAFEKFADAVGGTKHAFELLLAAFAAWKIAGTVAKFTALSTAAGEAGAAGSIGLLRTRLLALRALGPISVGVTVGLSAVWLQKKLGLPKGPSGIDILKSINKEIGFTEGIKIFGRNLGIGGGGGPRDKSLSSMGTLANMTRNAVAGIAATGAHAAQNAPSGTAGGGTAGRPLTGSALLSRAQRNALALASAGTPAAQLAALAEQREILANQMRSVSKRLARAQDPKKAAKLAEQLADLRQQDKSALEQITSINEAAAQDAKAAAQKLKDAAEKRKQAMLDAKEALYESVEGMLGRTNRGRGLPELGVDGTLSIGDVINAERANNVKAITKAKAAETAAQFRALGLTGTGDVRAPSLGALKSQLAKVSEAMRGTLLDTNENRNTIANVRKVLNRQWKGMNRDIRMRIKEMLDALSPDNAEPQLNARAFNVGKFVKQLGLTGMQAKRARSLLAGAHLTQPVAVGAGAAPITVHVHGVTDPNKAGRAVIKAIQKEKTRRAHQVRGQHAGNPLRFG